MYGHWLNLHRENPSRQRFWSTDLYRHLCCPTLERTESRTDGGLAVRATLDFLQAEKVEELEAWCRDHAETVLALRDIEADEESVLRVAKAIAAQVQCASLTLAALARGEPEKATTPTTIPSAPPPAKTVGLIELVEAWWREAERRGKSESTRESYTNTIKQLSAFLQHGEPPLAGSLHVRAALLRGVSCLFFVREIARAEEGPQRAQPDREVVLIL